MRKLNSINNILQAVWATITRLYAKAKWTNFKITHDAWQLLTRVGGGKYIVSTIESPVIFGSHPFETMVFPATKEPFDHDKVNVIANYGELDEERYFSKKTAMEGHEQMCWKWDGRGE